LVIFSITGTSVIVNIYLSDRYVRCWVSVKCC